MTHFKSSRSGKLFLLGIGLVFATIAFLVLLEFVVPLLVFGLQKGLIAYVADELVNLSGWNRNLVLGLLIPFGLPLFWAAREMLRVRFPTQLFGKKARQDCTGHLLR